MSAPIKAVVLGASGYVGGELLRLLAAHPDFELAAAVSESCNGRAIADIFANLGVAYPSQHFVAYDSWLDEFEPGDRLALFSAAPHGTSAALIAEALDAATAKDLEVHVVDASADFRYASQSEYEHIYGVAHGAPQLLSHFTCGVPEHVTETTAAHVGHPGCFATAALLAAIPIIGSGLIEGDVFVSAITGSTGSGRKPQAGTHHPERHSNLYAYKPLAHRHAPEVEALATTATGTETRVHFVPHSGPFARGIHATVQAKGQGPVELQALRDVYEQAYSQAPFVTVVHGTPRLKDVVASNYARIGVAVDRDALVVMCVIDNLVKGAAGGCVQWMNRLWGLPETTGLSAAAPGWT